MATFLAFLKNKWVHVLIVAVCAAIPAALAAAGVQSPVLDALATALAGGVGAHAGSTNN